MAEVSAGLNFCAFHSISTQECSRKIKNFCWRAIIFCFIINYISKILDIVFQF